MVTQVVPEWFLTSYIWVIPRITIQASLQEANIGLLCLLQYTCIKLIRLAAHGQWVLGLKPIRVIGRVRKGIKPQFLLCSKHKSVPRSTQKNARLRVSHKVWRLKTDVSFLIWLLEMLRTSSIPPVVELLLVEAVDPKNRPCENVKHFLLTYI